MRWDPAQYARYADERGRPFLDLIARIGHEAPRRVVDIGCGPGTLTRLLALRWPEAMVEGVDSSPEMIERAAEVATERLSFTITDAAEWQVPGDCDVIVSNATLQWVPRHEELIRRWATALPPGGWLAIQVPGNFDAPSHALMREQAESPRWRAQVGGVLRHHDAVSTPTEYASLLLDAGLSVDVWETTYVHLLSGPDPVLEWVRGTGLRPVLAVLDADDVAEFEVQYAAALRTAYPAGPHGTLLPYRRIFAVAYTGGV
jgi:trans-aconitate 2-methyltransferase